LVSKRGTAADIASQNELDCGFMEVTQGLEAVERGLDEERQTRKDEIVTPAETMTPARIHGETTSASLMSSATMKDGEDLSSHRCISNASTADEMSDCKPHKSDVSEEYYIKIQQTQDQLSEEIASLTRRLDSAPWTKSIEQDKQSIADLSTNAKFLAATVESTTSPGEGETSRSDLSDLKQEMRKEIADLGIFTAMTLTDRLTDFETTSNDRVVQLNTRLDGLAHQLHEHMERLDGLTPRGEAAESQLSVALATSRGQVELSNAVPSDLIQEILTELEDLRSASKVHREATEAFESAVLRDLEIKNEAALQSNNWLKDIDTKIDGTVLELTGQLDGLVSQVVEHTTRLDGLTQQVKAAESDISRQRHSEDGVQVEASHPASDLRQEIEEEIVDFEMASRGFGGAIKDLAADADTWSVRVSAEFSTTQGRAEDSCSDLSKLRDEQRKEQVERYYQFSSELARTLENLETMRSTTSFSGVKNPVEDVKSAQSQRPGQGEASRYGYSYSRQEMLTELADFPNGIART
jgi:hypothetical protein